MDREYQTLRRPVDRQLADAGALHTPLDIRTNEIILFELLCEVLIVVPARIPRARYCDTKANWMCFLSQSYADFLVFVFALAFEAVFASAFGAAFAFAFGASATSTFGAALATTAFLDFTCFG